MEHKMRRSRQQLTDEATKEILRNGREMTLALADGDGFPYAVPVNFVYDGNSIFFHSAPSGHKIDTLSHNNRVSACIIDKGDIVPEEFTTYFRSAIIFGEARFINNIDEKIKIFEMLSEKYSPGIDPAAEIARFINHVAIIRIDIIRMTGKESIELVRAR